MQETYWLSQLILILVTKIVTFHIIKFLNLKLISFGYWIYGVLELWTILYFKEK